MSTHVLGMEAAPLVLVGRAIAVYAFLLVALRLAGPRELGQLTSFDLILLLVLSNAVQNSINAGDNSLAGGLLSAITLVGVNWLVGYATYRWRWLERLLQGRPVRIVSDGKVHQRNLRRQLLTVAELRSALRKQGITHISDCKQVVLEPDGTLTAIRKGDEARPLEQFARSETTSTR